MVVCSLVDKSNQFDVRQSLSGHAPPQGDNLCQSKVAIMGVEEVGTSGCDNYEVSTL